MAKQNYQMVNSQIPYVGNKQVIYKDGNTEISLNSPHMSFEMSMHFLDKPLIEAYDSGRERKNQEKQAKENSALLGGN